VALLSAIPLLPVAVNVQLPPEKGGASAKAIFIDGESTFRPERIVQMAKASGLDPEKALKNITEATELCLEVMEEQEKPIISPAISLHLIHA